VAALVTPFQAKVGFQKLTCLASHSCLLSLLWFFF
jgi:hypothetical protein